MKIRMKFFVLIFTLLWTHTAVMAQEAFMPGTQDIPLMDGLRVDVSDDMNFDTPEGQVITFDAQSKRKTGTQIIDYYRDTLPRMGWTETETNHFVREKDSITLTVIRGRKPGVVRFEIMTTNTNE